MTDSAANALLDLISQNPSANGLRLAVEKGGCAGLQYAMQLDATRAGDEVIEHLGARVFVDPESSRYLESCTLDFQDGLAGSGFRIRNPQAARSCGCGTSFEPLAGGEQ